MLVENVDEGPRQRPRVVGEGESTGEQVDHEIELRSGDQSSANSSSASQQGAPQPAFVAKRTLSFELRAGDFLYNTRILFLVLISIAPILAMTGKYTLTLLITGLLAVYVLDFLAMKKWALVAFWGTLSIFWLSIYFSSFSFVWFSFFNIFTLMHGSMFVLLVGIWGSLQSDWFKSWSPELGVICERILFSAFPVICIPLIISVCIAIAGIRNAPFYLAIALCGIIHWFVKPERSSFKVPNNNVRTVTTEVDLYIQKRTDSAFLVTLAFILPSIMYLAVYHRTFELFNYTHYLTITVLASIPLMMISLGPNQYLWWFDILRDPQFDKLRLATVAGALANMVLWVEYRVIFERYPHIMAIPAPWNYVIVTAAAYALIGLAILVLKDQLGDTGRIFAVCLSSFIVACASFVVGFPLLLIPLPAVAMFEAASFYFTRNWRDYAIFGTTAALSLMIWLARSFWFLDYEFEFTLLPFDWTVNLTHALLAVSALAALSIAIIPAMLVPQLKNASLLILLLHGSVLGWLEQLLYEQGEGFYSPTLVFMTTGFGLYLASCLLANQRLSADSAALLMAVYLGKLGILLAPVRMALIATFFASVTLSRIYVATQTNEKISLQMCWAYIIAAGANLFLTRHVLVKSLLEFFMDTRYYQVTESRILGACVFLWGLHLVPLSYQFVSKNKNLKRITIALLIVGAVWAFWQPTFAVSGDDLMDLSEGSAGDYSAAWWVSWVIILVIVSALVAFATPKKYTQNTIVRLFLTCWVGFGFGLAFCGTYLGFAPLPMYFLICSSFAILGFLLYSTHYPLSGNSASSSAAGFMNINFLAYGVLFFLQFPSIALCFFIHQDSEVVRSSVIAVMGVFITLNIFLAILLKFKAAGNPIYRFKVSKKIQQPLAAQDSTELLELQCITNMAAITAYITGIVLIAWISWQNYLAYLIITSALLLLSTDKYLLRRFEDNHRYTLTFGLLQALVIAFFMIDYFGIVVAIAQKFSFGLLFRASLTLSTFFFAMPSHVFAFLLLYTLKKPNAIVAVTCAVLSLFSIVLAPFQSVFFNGVYGLAAALLQLFITAQFIPLSIKEQFLS